MPVDQVKASLPAEAIVEDLRVSKTVALVREKAVVTDAAPEAKKPAAKKTTTAKKTTSTAEKTTTTAKKTTSTAKKTTTTAKKTTAKKTETDAE